MKRLLSILGPRVPDTEPGIRRWRYVLPTVLLMLAASVLIASYQQPYWNMTLHAPQYPKGLHVQAYLNRLTGDVQEIDNLNHYIGMRPLNEAAQLERKTSHILIGSMALLAVAAVFIHTKWVVVLVIPAMLFPAGFLLDLLFWLHNFGQNLDPTAALSSSVKPFTPPVWGEGKVGNFRTVADVDVGWWMATTASCIILISLYFHRRAYKPLVDAQQRAAQRSASQPESHNEKSILQASSRTHHTSCGALRHSVLLAACTAVTVVSSARAETDFNLAQAIAATPEGGSLIVPAGVYYGSVLIDRALTLDGQGHAVLDGEGVGDVVRITAPNVTLRGFIIRNSGISLDGENSGVHVLAPETTIENNIIEDVLFGISVKSAPRSVIRNNSVGGKDLHIARRGDGIRLWDSNDSLVEANTVSKSRDVVMWYSDRVRLRKNRVSHSRYGLHFMYSHDNVLEDNHLEDNSVGAFLMYSRNLVVRRNVFARNRGPSGYGLGVKDMQGMVVEDNIFVGNCVGIYLDNPPVFLPEHDRFTRNVLAYNDIGLVFQPSVRRTAVFGNSFIENHQQVAVWGGGELRGNVFTVDGKGNYWSDYRGYDLTGDGIGDMPYRAENLWDNLMDREPSLRLFLFSPAQQAVELAAKAFPVMQARSLFTDDAPLMQPVRADVNVSVDRRQMPTFLLAAGLIGIAALALMAARPQFAGRGGPS